MGEEMDEVAARFETLLRGLAPAEVLDPADLLLRVMGPEESQALKKCAIPHTFNEELLEVMWPEITRDRVRALCDGFAALSIVRVDSDGMSLHDGTRQKLFTEWLDAQNFPAFSAISRRLADYFQRKENDASEQRKETAERMHMFHLIGAEQQAGFDAFERLCRCARSQFRLSECAALLRLVHEYDPILTAENTLRLAYHEGKLASDLRQWEEAEPLFRIVLESDSAPPELRVKALTRLGYLSGQNGLWDQAVDHYRKALDLAQKHPLVQGKLYRITHDLGVAYREKGDLAEGESLLRRSIELCGANNDQIGCAHGFNSLGVLQLKQGNVGAAIESFERSLQYLNEVGETFRTAQVLNNLGLAYDQRSEWNKSEEYYHKSLEIKRRAGDSVGQAFALNNLAKTQRNQGTVEEAVASLTEALSLFEQMRDKVNQAVTRRNRGKLYCRLGNKERCTEDLTEAMRLFELSGRGEEAASVNDELQSLQKGRKLPWWGWVAIVLFSLMICIIILIVIFEES